MAPGWIPAVVVGKAAATSDIAVLDLAPADGSEFPEFEAGSHIDVRIGDSGLVRQYSLCGPFGEKSYRLAVLRAPDSRGGSTAMHGLRIGDAVQVSSPRNLFPLAPVSRHILFAGGIGITPMLAMAYFLDGIDAHYELHYSARSSDAAAFVDELGDNPRVQFHFGDERLNMSSVLGRPVADTAVYTCGPAGFMNWVLDGAKELGWSSDSLHRELFAPSEPVGGEREAGEFTVRLASSGAEYTVAADSSVLDILLENNVDAPSSCQQGICGECLITVLAGDPDHRDDVLTDDEKAEGLFATCISRSHSEVLELDI